MSTDPFRSPLPRDRGGFVLVGVVMIVLALTILGLSLFSLSSYEAQFLNRTVDGEQALQFAMGGLDRARFALTVSPPNLSNVKQNLPYERVLYARAMQDKGGPVADSMGVVLGSGNDVEILVEAEYHGIRRRVQGRYQPSAQENYYKRVMTVAAGGITVNDTVGGTWEACGTVLLGGPLEALDSCWVNNPVPFNCATSPGITYGVNHRYVPVPSVASFLANPPGPVTTVPYNGTSYSFDGPAGVVRYWYTHGAVGEEFSVRSTGPLTITVNGLAVWLLPQGIRADHQLTIRSGGDPNACLVIVARNGKDIAYNDWGAVWTFAGMLAQIPVIFVTDGSVKLETNNQVAAITLAPNISIFAGHVLLTGPTSNPVANPSLNVMTLTYQESVMNPLIDQLMAAGALPNGVTTSPFTLRPGTWRVVQ